MPSLAFDQYGFIAQLNTDSVTATIPVHHLTSFAGPCYIVSKIGARKTMYTATHTVEKLVCVESGETGGSPFRLELSGVSPLDSRPRVRTRPCTAFGNRNDWVLLQKIPNTADVSGVSSVSESVSSASIKQKFEAEDNAVVDPDENCSEISQPDPPEADIKNIIHHNATPEAAVSDEANATYPADIDQSKGDINAESDDLAMAALTIEAEAASADSCIDNKVSDSADAATSVADIDISDMVRSEESKAGSTVEAEPAASGGIALEAELLEPMQKRSKTEPSTVRDVDDSHTQYDRLASQDAGTISCYATLMAWALHYGKVLLRSCGRAVLLSFLHSLKRPYRTVFSGVCSPSIALICWLMLLRISRG